MNYRYVREIGRGAFGVVDLVIDGAGVSWARKTFQPPPMQGVSVTELRERFEREIRYQSQIDHPNVAKIHDYNITSDPPWFLMEKAECSLADELASDRTLAGNPGKSLFDILAGLEAMHDRGFKHRDLKPANVLKFASGANTRYAISDFGLMAPAAGTTTTLTMSHMGGGTVQYAAPECVTNFRRATEQSDIYSFGAILHDVFAGGSRRTPYTELSVPGPLNGIVQQCTKKNIRRRYASVAILRQELYSVLSSEVISFSSTAEKEAVDLLQRDLELSDGDWDVIFDQIDTNRDNQKSNHAIFRALTIPKLQSLSSLSPGLFISLGSDYADYAQTGSFDWDYCDIIAGNAEVFYQNGDLELQARIALALLQLGIEHNRWFVERKFLQMAGPAISDALALRIRVEIEVQKIDFNYSIERLTKSIKVEANVIHPILYRSISQT